MTTYKGWRNDNFSVPNNIYVGGSLYLGDGGKAISDTQKGIANGVATLGADSKVPPAQLPNLALANIITSGQVTLALYISVEWVAGTIQIGDIVEITTTEGTVELWMLSQNDGDAEDDYKKIDASKVNWANILDKPNSTVSDIDDAVDEKHLRLHAIDSTFDHTSSATSGKMLKADANGLPIEASNTDTEVSTAVTQAAAAIPSSQKGVANGVATLDGKGLLTSTQIPQELLDTLCAGKPFYTGSGIDQYIYVPDNTEMEMELGDFSYQTIICLPDYTPSTPVTIARHANGADFLGWIFTIGTDGKLNLAIGNGSNFITYSYTSTLAVRHADGRIAEVGFCADRDGYVEFFDFFGSLGKVDMSNSVAQTVTATNPANLVFFQNIDGTIEYNFMGLWKVEYWNFALTCAKWMEYAKSGNPHKYQGANKTISHWTEVAPQLGSQTDIYSLAVFNGKLYGGTCPNGCLFEWNGEDSWIQVAPQLNSQTHIRSLAVFNGKLYGGTYPNGLLFVVPQPGCFLDLNSIGIGHYSFMDNSGNKLHGINSASVPAGLKIGDRRIAYLSTTSESPTMTDVIKGGWKVIGFSFETAQNLTDIDATQETSNIKLIENKTLNNGYLNCNTIADHPYYENGIDKDIIFNLTGNGGAGTVIKVELEKVK